jgi:quaternary ammonium compound-resistance protein SugE
MNWILLIIGGLFEALFAFSLSKISITSGKEMYLWILSFIISVSLSMLMLYKAIDNGVNVSVGYAVWSGLGATLTVLAGIFILKEPVSTLKLLFLCTLILSIVGLIVGIACSKDLNLIVYNLLTTCSKLVYKYAQKYLHIILINNYICIEQKRTIIVLYLKMTEIGVL